jgi:hypothetical protein
MILQFRTRADKQDEYIICLETPLSIADIRDRMLERAEVAEGSYAHGLINDLHAAIFIRSLDLKNDYYTYFRKEYASFGKYLSQRVRLPGSVVRKLEAVHDASAGIYRYRRPLYFLSEQYGVDFLSRLLGDNSTERNVE